MPHTEEVWWSLLLFLPRAVNCLSRVSTGVVKGRCVGQVCSLEGDTVVYNVKHLAIAGVLCLWPLEC